MLGGSGRLGARVVARLLASGCQVRALVHNGTIAADGDLTIVKGDVHDPASLSTLLNEADAVVSTLGNQGAPVANICATAMANLTPLMTERRIRRIVSTTGSAARLDAEIGVEHPWLASRRAALMRHMGPFIRDAESHIRMLAASGLDWTVIRAPIMTGSTGQRAGLAEHPSSPDTTLAYDAVAAQLVDELLEPRWLGAAPFAVPV